MQHHFSPVSNLILAYAKQRGSAVPLHHSLVIESAGPDMDVDSPLELMMVSMHGDVTPEEYGRRRNLRNSTGVRRMLG